MPPDTENHTSTAAKAPKERHGCFTVYLVLLVLATTFGTLSYLLMSDEALLANDPELPDGIRRPTMVLLNAFLLASAVAMWKWKRWGVWLFIAVGLGGWSIKAAFSSFLFGSLIAPVAGILILLVALRIGDKRKPWDQFE